MGDIVSEDYECQYYHMHVNNTAAKNSIMQWKGMEINANNNFLKTTENVFLWEYKKKYIFNDFFEL